MDSDTCSAVSWDIEALVGAPLLHSCSHLGTSSHLTLPSNSPLLRLVGLTLPPQPAGPAEARVSESSRLLAEEGNEPEGDAKVAFVTGSNTGDKSVLPLRVV